MSKHTPKPWVVVDRQVLEDGSVYPKHIIGGVTELQVCLFETPNVAHAIVNDESWKYLGKSEMHEANAQLIAAAPELYEAAKLVLAWYDAEEDHSQEPDFYKRVEMCRASESAIRAAIAKAEGGAA